MAVGFSTGVFWKTGIHPVSKRAIEAIAEVGCNAIEISSSRLERFHDLSNIERKDLEVFDYCSLHAPVRIGDGKFIYRKDQNTEDAIKEMEYYCDKLGFDNVVAHADVVEDWSVFAGRSFQLSVENSDNRKVFGKTVEDMQEIFYRYDYKMVLDLNHCYVNDKTMRLAKQMQEAFGDRICEYHVSGHVKLHEPLFVSKQIEIIQSIQNKNIPIINEGTLENVEDLEKEYKYMTDNLL